MSNKAMDWAWDSGLKPGPRLVLLALSDHGSDHSGEDWTCFPSVKRLIAMTGFSRAAAERHLTDLELAGWLSRKRRIRPDGTQGVYDYRLHRDPEKREALRVQRADKLTRTGKKHAARCVKLRHGPCVDLAVPAPQIEEPDASNRGIINPQDNPQRTLTEGARASPEEPGSQGFAVGLAAYPESGRKRTNIPLSKAAWALACDRFGMRALTVAVSRYAAEDPDLSAGDFGAPAFEKWLSGERYLSWLPAQGAADPPAVRFPGPEPVRTAFAAALGEPWARSWIDACGWDPEARALIARTEFRAKQIRDGAWQALRDLEITVIIEKAVP